MAQERAQRPEPLRVVRGGPAETPILSLAEGVEMYSGLLEESRRLQAVIDGLRGRILRAMERLGLDQLTTDGFSAVRQVRHFPPELDEARATSILEREGRLRDALRAELDPEKAREVLDELYVQGRIRREELPFTPPRTVEALIVRSREEKTG